MFNLDSFLEKLDEMYNNPKELEDYLAGGVSDALAQNDKGAALVILNELMGLYRVTDKYEKCLNCAEKALALSDELGIKGTVNYGTVLLNIATAYRVMKRYDEAQEYYFQVKEIFEKGLDRSDYRMAALYNNLSLLYSETGRLEDAKNQLETAMEIIKGLDNSDIEIAITHTNLGNLYFALHNTEKGAENMRRAVEIFENQPGEKDAHYPSALSGLGEAYFNMGDLEKSAQCYQKALKEIGEHYGINEYYRVTKENLDLVEDTLKRRKQMATENISGLSLAEMYYETYGKSIICEKLEGYKNSITVGLAGEGSECLGFDDEYSTDHDYGPSFCIWVDGDVFDEIGEDLKRKYDSLPKEFLGFSARNVISTGKGRVGVIKTEDFYKNIIGLDHAPMTDEEWNNIPQEFLCTASNGRIFESGNSNFMKIRKQISYYPERVRRQKIAVSLGQMSQTGQANYPRMIRRGDVDSAQLCINEFVKSAVECAYLLNKTYMPYYKWQFKGMEKFTCLKEAKDLLHRLLLCRAGEKDAEILIEEICRLTVKELKKQGLSKSDDNFLEHQKNEVMKNAF